MKPPKIISIKENNSAFCLIFFVDKFKAKNSEEKNGKRINIEINFYLTCTTIKIKIAIKETAKINK